MYSIENKNKSKYKITIACSSCGKDLGLFDSASRSYGKQKHNMGGF